MKILVVMLSLLFFVACMGLKQPTTTPATLITSTPIVSSSQIPYVISPNDIIIAQEELLQSIYRKALPSIVQVKVETVINQRSFFGRLRRYNIPSEGTGFIWDESADTFQVGTTTATGSSTGNLSVTDAPFAAAAIRLVAW